MSRNISQMNVLLAPLVMSASNVPWRISTRGHESNTRCRDLPNTLETVVRANAPQTHVSGHVSGLLPLFRALRCSQTGANGAGVGDDEWVMFRQAALVHPQTPGIPKTWSSRLSHQLPSQGTAQRGGQRPAEPTLAGPGTMELALPIHTLCRIWGDARCSNNPEMGIF